MQGFFFYKHHQSLLAAIIEKTFGMLNTVTIHPTKSKNFTTKTLIIKTISITVIILILVFSAPDRWIRI